MQLNRKLQDASRCLVQAPEQLKTYLTNRGVDLAGADKLQGVFWVSGDKLPEYGMAAGDAAEACLVLQVSEPDNYFTAPVCINLYTGKKRVMTPKSGNDATRSRPYFPPNFDPSARVIQVEKPVGALAAASHGATNVFSLNGVATYSDPRYLAKTSHPEVKELHASGVVEEILICNDSDSGEGQNGRGNPEVNRHTRANIALYRKEAPNIRVGTVPLRPSYDVKEGFTKRGVEDWIGDIGWESTKKVYLDCPIWHIAKHIQLNPISAAVTGLFSNSAPEAPKFIVENLLPEQVGALNATGGVGKTTLLLWMIAHIVTGRPLFGNAITRTGPVLYLTGEDERQLLLYRLHCICQHMNLTDEEKANLEQNFFIEDVSGVIARLAESDSNGNVVQTQFIDTIIDTYGEEKLSLLVIDPLMHFSPGERFVNDGMQAIIASARRLFTTLNCAVLLVHHVSKVQAQNGGIDQHSGRGGTALGDGARFIWQLASHSTHSTGMPRSITPELLVQGATALALHPLKLTFGPLQNHPYWITRTGYDFQYHKPEFASSEELAESAEMQRAERVVAYIRRQIKLGVDHSTLTKTQLRGLGKEVLGFGKEAAEKAITLALAQGWLVETGLPPSGKGGPPKTYLTPAAKADANDGAA